MTRMSLLTCFPPKQKANAAHCTPLICRKIALDSSPLRRQQNLLEPHETHTRLAREPTEQPEERNAWEYSPCLELRFSHPPKTCRGLVAGRCPRADLVLPTIKGVSWYHFTLTFDDQDRLIVRDLGSTVGTRVIYDGEDGERGHNVDWSATGPNLVKNKTPVIKVVGDLQFRLVVPDHNTTSKIYLDNVAKFRQGTAATENLFSDLDLQSHPQTEAPTPRGVHLPSESSSGPILWRRELGRGVFGVVTYVWNVTTREECALKEPVENLRKNRGLNIEAWKNEANILKHISHDHIVAFRDAKFSPWPQLYFEYLPGGSLDSYPSTCTFHNKQVLTQLLSALTYLHGLQPQVVHRDIKPQNILILSWTPDEAYVKFADFGLSKQADYLKTFCGTLAYAAPEVYGKQLDKDKRVSKYASSVDIWSLGVVIAERECGGLPEHRSYYRKHKTAWGEAIVRQAWSHLTSHGENEVVSFLLNNMLVINPEGRQPAVECYNKALQLSGGETSRLLPELASSHKPNDDFATSSDCDQSGEESDVGTPKAPPLNISSSLEGLKHSEASTIHDGFQENGNSNQTSQSSDVRAVSSTSLIADLGYRNTDLIDSLLNLKPSQASVFQRSYAPTTDTQLHQGLNMSVGLSAASLLADELRNTEVSTTGHAPAASFKQNESHQDVAVPVSSDLRSSIIDFGYGARGDKSQDGKALELVAAGMLPSARKRARPGNQNSGNVSPSSSTDRTAGCVFDEAEGHLGLPRLGRPDRQTSKRSKVCNAATQV